MLCLLGAANRDPAAIPSPDQLDITRAEHPRAFVRRRHPLLPRRAARAHRGEIAISTLLRRLPDLKIDDVDNPEWRPTFVLRGLKSLPASW